MKAREILEKYFGYFNFRTGQEEIIGHILNGEDALGIMPTGAGKSICYQIPAVIFDGITIVISPLISLMKDQVDSLNAVGIPSTFVNSTLSDSEYRQTMQNIQYNIYKIIYVAPERLQSPGFVQLIKTLNVSMIAIDEAHCVSQWGHDFRPSYIEISNIVESLPVRPIVVAFTATATEIVKKDIIKLLKLKNPFTLVTGFDRKNLYYSVETPHNKFEFIVEYLKKHKNDSGIIYCATRKNVDSIYDKLVAYGFNVSKYHAGISESSRTNAQNDFLYDRTSIMVATNAFGMGIDKSNVRFVIHYNMPQDLESYYQEAGRAGRDGEKSECILLFSRSDIVTNKFLIESTSSGSHTNEYQKLNEIVDYCNTSKCLRKYILEYFGETPEFESCQHCSNCNSTIETTDITQDAQKILSCIKRMGEHYGAGLVADVLKGANTVKIRNFKFDNLSTYGIMSDYSKETIRDLISFLIAEDYLRTVGDEYPYLALTNNAQSVLFKNEKIIIKKKIEKIDKNKSSEKIKNTEKNNQKIFDDSNINKDLFEVLRKLRMDVAVENKVPPFIIFADTSLKQMATSFPTTEGEMLKISGVGEFKMEKYGQKFIDEIVKFKEENNL